MLVGALKANCLMVILTAKDFISLIVEVSTKDFGVKVLKRATAEKLTPLEGTTLVNGKMVKNMEMVSSTLKMETDMKVNGKMENKTATVSLSTRMETDMKASGRMEWSTGSGSTSTRMVR